jgi:hypothetical protein
MQKAPFHTMIAFLAFIIHPSPQFYNRAKAQDRPSPILRHVTVIQPSGERFDLCFPSDRPVPEKSRAARRVALSFREKAAAPRGCLPLFRPGGHFAVVTCPFPSGRAFLFYSTTMMWNTSSFS